MDGSLIKTLLLRSQTVLGPVRAVTSHSVSVVYLAPTQLRHCEAQALHHCVPDVTFLKLLYCLLQILARVMPQAKLSKTPDLGLAELAGCLRQERLYVSYERKQLVQLNETVAASGRRLAQTSWTTSMQRDNLEGLVMSRAGSSPQHSCQVANLLQQTQFTDAYKVLGHHMTIYSEFLASLRNSPSLVAEWLTLGDKLGIPLMKEVVMTVFTSLLGSCVLSEDESIMITMLHKLVETQLLEAANPRKLLRHGTSSFSRLYKLFSEQLFSSRIFLTSALYEPILSLLTDDETFLDIDPAKAVYRFPPQERLRRFGVEGTEEYSAALATHRQAIIAKLAGHAQRFVIGIRDNLHSLPSFLSNLIKIIFNSMETRGIEPREIWAVCTDVLFNSFICPAIVDPEPKGITDMPISYRHRFNLMQVAQIIQVLALWKWEDINPAHQDLYQQFDKNLVPGLIDSILRVDNTEGQRPREDLSNVSTGRMAVLITAEQLQNITEWLNAVREMTGLDEEVRSKLNRLLIPLPQNVPGRKRTPAKVKTPEAATKDTAEEASPGDNNFGKHKAALAAKLSSVGSKVKPLSPGQSVTESLSQTGPEKVLVVPITDSPSELPGLAGEEVVLRQSRGSHRVRMNLSGLLEAGGGHINREESLTSASGEVQEKRTRFSLSHDEGSIGNTSDNLEAISEAASNHSVASSLEDEVDPGDQDQILDNMSDMVSANVSGRGTPNVSGRDTPSSQVTEGEIEERGAPDVADVVPPQPDPQREELINLREPSPPQGNNVLNGNRKEPEQDIEEKFGRFDIKPEVRRGRLGQLMGAGAREGDRDEAVSMVSDTWSTDVLSSDTETVGEPPTLEDLLRGRPGDEFSVRNRMLDHLQVPSGDHEARGQNTSGHLLDIAETGSEAWSMDVLASDSESLRVADFDLEDSMSVARSDDTRFTDDTTRSDPDQINLQRLELSSEAEGRRKGVENWARSGGATTGNPTRRRDSDGSGHSNRHESILKKPSGGSTLPILVGSEHSGQSSICLDDSAVTDGPPDLSRLSTTSIASSNSSRASGGSVEAVCPPQKSRSNSSASAGAGSLVSGAGGAASAEAAVTQQPVTQASTGAIPKSISFDKSADKEDDNISSENKQFANSKRERGFFKNWKLPKMGRRGGGRGSKVDEFQRSSDGHNHRLIGDTFNIPEHGEHQIRDPETSEDILAKYRKKPAEDKADGTEMGVSQQQRAEDNLYDPAEKIDRDNLETSFVFQDARRKLRLVLSEVC